jgi:hypothetical protein
MQRAEPLTCNWAQQIIDDDPQVAITAKTDKNRSNGQDRAGKNCEDSSDQTILGLIARSVFG